MSLQPDVLWAGGVTELVKICTLASTYEVEVVPHAHTVATIQVLAAQPASLCPMLEFLMNHSIIHQFFFKEPRRAAQRRGDAAGWARHGCGDRR